MKVITKRLEKQSPLEEADALLKTMRGLRGDALIPKGVYRFHTPHEAHQWMIKTMARTHAHLKSKT